MSALSMDDYAALLLVIAAVAVILEAPLLKPWSGFRKPKGHPGRWFQ